MKKGVKLIRLTVIGTLFFTGAEMPLILVSVLQAKMIRKLF
jgi:hypothetical protein